MGIPQPFKPLLIPLRDGFRMLSVGPTKGYEMVADGLLDVRKIGNKSVVTVASVESCAENLPRFG